jgi:hypothetical protein
MDYFRPLRAITTFVSCQLGLFRLRGSMPLKQQPVAGRHICVSGVSEIVYRVILGSVLPTHEKRQSLLIR